MSDWPAERYPVLFHNLLASGGGVVPASELPWAPSTTRVRWFEFVRTVGDARTWTVEVSELGLVLRARPKVADTARKVLKKWGKNFRVGG